jgi:hypothetical protein
MHLVLEGQVGLDSLLSPSKGKQKRSQSVLAPLCFVRRTVYRGGLRLLSAGLLGFDIYDGAIRTFDEERFLLIPGHHTLATE